MDNPGEFLFSEDKLPHGNGVPRENNKTKQTWKILIVDDEDDVHDVTRLALRRLIFEGRRLEFHSARTAGEARELLRVHPDFAVILLDVVMESENAGLTLVHFIRRDLENNMSRIIIRTGHPGQAPEESVTFDYDINDYQEKTELTTQRLITAVITALRSYRDLSIIDENRRDLKQVIGSTVDVFRLQSSNNFAASILSQLSRLSHLKTDGEPGRVSGFVAERRSGSDFFIHSATGIYRHMTGGSLADRMSTELWQDVVAACESNASLFRSDRILIPCSSVYGPDAVICLEGLGRLSEWDRDLIEILRLNYHIAFDNVYLNQEVEATQKELLFTLGEIAETRSAETGQHVKRVAEISRILALRLGITEEEASHIRLAAAMHDIGKLAIHQSILDKPGTLTPEEFAVMKTHSRLGYEMLKTSKRPLLQAAAVIANEHHENFDGSGYPQGLSGYDIHIYSRIVALADVFDALGNKRVYKGPWSHGEIIDYIREQSGKKFDPQLVDLFFRHLKEILRIREMFPDGKPRDN